MGLKTRNYRGSLLHVPKYMEAPVLLKYNNGLGHVGVGKVLEVKKLKGKKGPYI